MRIIVALALALSSIVLGCGPSATGRACDSTNPCPNHFVCAPAHDGVDRCMLTCNLSETVCNDGTACLPIAGSGACYLGGNVAIGSSCASDLDCTRTAICISSGSSTQCRVGCNTDGTHGCTGGQFCQPTVGSAGFCPSL